MISVSAEGLCKDYVVGTRRDQRVVSVLKDINLTINSGEFVSIVGPSGSGKSTLLYCLAGLVEASSGMVNLAGQNVTSMKREAISKLRRQHVGFVFQSFCLIPSLGVADNVALQAHLSGTRLPQEQIAAALKKVNLAGRGSERVSSLSGGEQQRVAVARAIAANPDIIFADEPTGSLDAKSGADVLELLRDHCKSAARTLLLVTHDLSAAALADRAIVLRDGRIGVEEQSPTAKRLFELMEVE